MSSPSATPPHPHYTCTLYTDQKKPQIGSGVRLDSLDRAPIEAKTMATAVVNGIQEFGNNYCFLNNNTVVCGSSLANARLIRSKNESGSGDINIMCNNLDDADAKSSVVTRLCTFSTGPTIPHCPK